MSRPFGLAGNRTMSPASTVVESAAAIVAADAPSATRPSARTPGTKSANAFAAADAVAPCTTPVTSMPAASARPRARVATSVESLVSVPSGATSPTTSSRAIR